MLAKYCMQDALHLQPVWVATEAPLQCNGASVAYQRGPRCAWTGEERPWGSSRPFYALMRFVRWLSAKNFACCAIFCVFVWQFDILIIERNRNIFWISFVVSEDIRTFASYCLPVTWDWRKDGTKLLIAQFPDELQHRKGKTSKHYHIGVGALCANFNICGNGLLQTCLGIWRGLRFLYTHIVSADLPIVRKVKQLIIPNF